MKKKKIKFKNKQGQELDAELDLPASKGPHNYVIFAHCFTCNKQFKSVKEISRGLTSEGFGVLKFDFTGLGMSEGEFEETNFSSNIDDLKSAADYLSENYTAPTLLVGHSLGGAAALKAGSELESIKAIATIAAPFDPEHVAHLFEDKLDEIKESGEAEVHLAGRPFTIKKQFIDDISSQQVKSRLKDMRKSLLIMHSPQDEIVNVENARELYDNAIHPKSFISLDGADHLLSKAKDARYAGKVIANWASRYLDIPETDVKLETDKEVVVELRKEDKFTTEVQAGIHHFLADEPKDVGGENLGPTPYELLNAGLGSCTAMTLHMYARRKNWPLEKVFVHLSHFKKHKDDCEEGSKLDEFKREIEIEGDLDDKQIKRLVEIANKCPVHETLTKGVTVTTELMNSK